MKEAEAVNHILQTPWRSMLLLINTLALLTDTNASCH